LALIILFLLLLSVITEARENLLQNDEKLFILRRKVSPLFQAKFSDSEMKKLGCSVNTLKNLMAEIKLHRGDKSYTINKEKIFLCLRDEKGSYYTDNMLLYVLIHELAHCVCREIGHTDTFNEIFQVLLDKASALGIYDPNVPVIQDYCQY
jgi:hypothetical protein